MLTERLARRGYRVEADRSSHHALERLRTVDYDVLVTDLRMPEMDGVELCQRASECCPELPVILLTGFGSLEAAVEAIRAGAYDFVEKPVTMDLLQIAIDRAATHRAARREIRRLREQSLDPSATTRLLGDSDAMRAVRGTIARIAPVETTVLVTGETGTGKELVARAVHDASQRRDKPFVALNCTTVPDSLFESELFGHARGAFTDARGARAGLFEQARGGTLFLDEIGDLPSTTQPKLLRVLQEKTFRPVGGDAEQTADARVIAATNVDLEAHVDGKRFREDLYYRLDVMRIDLPALRQRGTDVLLLATRFVDRFAHQLGKPVRGLDPTAAERLLTYDWPGNVRELQNCIERAVALTTFDQIRLDDLPEKVRSQRPRRPEGSVDPSDLLPLRTIELRYVREVYEAVGRNKSVAARVLGLDRKTLQRKLQGSGVDDDS